MGRSKNSSAAAKSSSKASKAVEAGERAVAPPKAKVIAFYSDREGRKYREFSNFYRDSKVPPFNFVLPDYARMDGLPETVLCEFSEKAIMLVKAGLMGDKEAFESIMAASNPKDCKALGRGVQNFDEDIWKSHLEETAYEVVRQKFDSCQLLRDVLLSTGDSILAEAAPNDAIWGIGLSIDDDLAYDPMRWCGQNVLGYALMRARCYLRGEPANVRSASPPASGYAALRSGLPAEEHFLRPCHDLEAVRACYEQYGVVGVTGVLSPDECLQLITNGLEPCLPEGCSMRREETFTMADAAMNRFGVVGKGVLFNPAILSARLHPNVSAAYAAVHGRTDVFASHDRFAWMRPVALNAAWDTPFSWPGLHFDVNLRSYFEGSRLGVDEFLCSIDYNTGNFVAESNAKHCTMGRTVQGVLSLLDNEEEDGGFHCVPGMFGPALQNWVREHSDLPAPKVNGRYNLKDYGPDAILGRDARRVPCPAGTLILFDATLPHGTKPNISARSRAILFMRYITSDELPAQAWRNRNAALRRVAEEIGFEPSEEQERHMYGPE